MNYEIKEKIETKTKELTPELFDDYITTYPGLKSAYEDVLEAVMLMNKIIQEYDQNFDYTELDNWNKRQSEFHDKLIDSVTEFIDDLAKFDSNEAKMLKNKYNQAKENRLFFTQLALKFLNK